MCILCTKGPHVDCTPFKSLYVSWEFYKVVTAVLYHISEDVPPNTLLYLLNNFHSESSYNENVTHLYSIKYF